MRTIYKTTGAALEYCEYAVDIYNYCPHECAYCYVKEKADRKNTTCEFTGVRPNIIEETRHYLKSNPDIKGKTIFLGFSSDAFPRNCDVTPTLEMIKLLKEYDCKVMLLTKGDFNNDTVKQAIKLADSIGVTITCGPDMAYKYESKAASPYARLDLLMYAHSLGKETWISFEPVLEPAYVLRLLSSGAVNFITTAKLGKLNHMELSDITHNPDDKIDWTDYVTKATKICKEHNINYIIKDALAAYQTNET